MHVYLLRTNDNRRFKIGWAVDIHRRIRVIGGETAFDMKRSLCIPHATKRKAYHLERVLHILFNSYRCNPVEGGIEGRTEYFSIGCWDRVVQFLVANAGLTGTTPPAPLPPNSDERKIVPEKAPAATVVALAQRTKIRPNPPVPQSTVAYRARREKKHEQRVAEAVAHNRQSLSHMTKFVDLIETGNFRIRWRPPGKRRHGCELVVRCPRGRRGSELMAHLDRHCLFEHCGLKVTHGWARPCCGHDRYATQVVYRYNPDSLKEGCIFEAANKEPVLAEQCREMLAILDRIPRMCYA